MKKGNSSKIKNETRIGKVNGPLHTGSGDIKVDNLVYGTTVSENTILELLQTLKREIVRIEDVIPKEVTKKVIAEISKVEKEVKSPETKPASAIGRLEKAKKLLLDAVGVATATTATVSAVEKLVPYIEKLIEFLHKLI